MSPRRLALVALAAALVPAARAQAEAIVELPAPVPGGLLSRPAPAKSTGTARSPRLSGAGRIIISEYRTRGPQGTQDEFYELYNPGTTTFSFAHPTTTTRYVLLYKTTTGYSFIDLTDFPSLPAGEYARLVVSTANPPTLLSQVPGSLDGWDAFSDHWYYLTNLDSPDGAIAFGTLPTTSPTIGSFVQMDGVATLAPNNTGVIGEGAKVPFDQSNPATNNGQPTIVRKLDAAGEPIDTNNNANDFLFLNGNGVGASGVGVPSPEGEPGVKMRDATVPVTLADPAQPATAAPNQVQVGSGTGSTLFIRRKLTNQSGAAFNIGTAFRYRSLTVPGFRTASQADIRPVSTSDANLGAPGTALATTVGGSTGPYAGTPQGVNSDAFTTSPFANGTSKILNFGFTVVRPGRFEIRAVVEAG